MLYADEPSTGLDSFSAYSVVNTLRELAGFSNDSSESRIVVTSIHQPSSEVFHLFTNIILMNAGRIIYQGKVEEAEKLFTSINLSCPPRCNPAEFYINIISDPKKSTEVVKRLAINEKDAVTSSSSSSSSLEGSSCSEMEQQQMLPWIEQCRVISHRAILNFVRAPTHYLIELFILIVRHKFSKEFH